MKKGQQRRSKRDAPTNHKRGKNKFRIRLLKEIEKKFKEMKRSNTTEENEQPNN